MRTDHIVNQDADVNGQSPSGLPPLPKHTVSPDFLSSQTQCPGFLAVILSRESFSEEYFSRTVLKNSWAWKSDSLWGLLYISFSVSVLWADDFSPLWYRGLAKHMYCCHLCLLECHIFRQAFLPHSDSGTGYICSTSSMFIVPHSMSIKWKASAFNISINKM